MNTVQDHQDSTGVFSALVPPSPGCWGPHHTQPLQRAWEHGAAGTAPKCSTAAWLHSPSPGGRGAGAALAGGVGGTDGHLGVVDRWTPRPPDPAGAGCRQTALLHTLGQQSSLKASNNNISHGEGC